MGALLNKERERIFRLFSSRVQLKFTEIEKLLKIRSNVLAYYLSCMQKESLVEKRGRFYRLTKQGEQYLPILTQKTIAPLAVVLVALKNKDKMLLIKRNKRPYKGYWALIGGKLLLDETIEQASLRLVKEKAGLEGEFVAIRAIAHEHAKQEENVKHSFLLIMTEVKTNSTEFKSTNHGSLRWVADDKLQKDMIPSDQWLAKNEIKNKLKMTKVILQEKNGKIKSFKIN